MRSLWGVVGMIMYYGYATIKIIFIFQRYILSDLVMKRHMFLYIRNGCGDGQ
jgi:hypothetical protein